MHSILKLEGKDHDIIHESKIDFYFLPCTNYVHTGLCMYERPAIQLLFHFIMCVEKWRKSLIENELHLFVQIMYGILNLLS